MTDFDKYIRQGEPDSREKAQVWQTAIGLQDVDGLKPSEYLLQITGRHIQEYPWYFRNALVRANYNNYTKGISATTSFLELFFRNLLFGEKNELHNRVLHIATIQRANINDSKSQNDTLNCSLGEIALLKFLKDNPNATQTEIAVHIGKSLRTVKRMTPSLIERGLLKRENGKRNGRWIVKNINSDC